MKLCRRDCLHRQKVSEYRDARDAWEALKETSEFARYSWSEFREMYEAPTFKAWLIATAGANKEPEYLP